MTNKKTVKEVSITEVNNNIETSLDEITNVEEYISQIIGNCNFYKLNDLTDYDSSYTNKDEKTYDFISVTAETINDQEFFEIVDSNGKECKKTSGLYQQSLFSRYLEAKEQDDWGYIHDIFQKAIEYRDNLERIKELRKNKKFMKEWRQNVGKINPESELKNTGSMRKIHIIESLSM